MYFLSRNLLDSASLSLLSGITNAHFPLENLKEYQTTKTFRSASEDTEILVDLGGIYTVDTFAIAGSNIEGIGVTSLSIQLSGTTDFSSSPIMVIPLNPEYALGYLDFSPSVCRYVKISTSNTGGFSELSNIFIGQKIHLSTNGLSTDTFAFEYQNNSVTSSNRYGQRFITRSNKVKVMRGTVQIANYQETKLIEDIYNTHGQDKPLWVIVDPQGSLGIDGKFKYSGYFYISNNFTQSAQAVNLFDIELELVEVV